MSDPEKEITGGHNTSEADEFARLFSNFMRNSFANNQPQPNQMIEANKPENTTPYRIDSQPLIVGMKLNGENYPVWSVLMRNSISGRGMISHITGVPPPPQQADHCVFTWLVQNLETKLISRVMQQPTAKHIWDSLAVTYASGGDAIQIYDLYRRASTLKQGNDTLEDVWNSLSEIWTAVDLKKPNRMEYPPDIDRHNEDTQNMGYISSSLP